MDIHFSAEMKIGSKNYNIWIFIYYKIKAKKFNTNVLLFENEIWNSFLTVFIFKFVNWLMVNTKP